MGKGKNQIKSPQSDRPIGGSIAKKDLKPGDHIYTWRLLGAYSHHGIYVGDGIVINFNTPDTTCMKEDAIPESKRCPTCNRVTVDDATGITIVKTCLEHFGSTIYLYKYGVSWAELYISSRGTRCLLDAKPFEETVSTALEKLKTGFGKYNVLANNCEHFATYCKTGVKLSAQINIPPLPVHELL
ncbi:LRAT domain-containing protein [Cephalotus follicularis]|uniref:LRAT domain-containing protein n=1 Tax=Cephalotus follicularis TaxID=3775 RepID=A0A1Q3DJD6_CEPFO|nr:LRAT domain-containing protein [Cephalotus follicularis]